MAAAACASVSLMTERECGEPAPFRRGMCEHEHLREGPCCDQHAAWTFCKPCYDHPVSPHACPVRFEDQP
jgi:hypothetical protein